MGRALSQGRWTRVAFGLTWSCLAAFGVEVAAQEEVTPGPEVLALINEGAAASDAGEYWRAVEALERAIALQPLNVAYLNLGRALQKSGKCFESREAYDAVASAPKVAGVDAATIEGYVTRYLEELRGECPGRLRFLCDTEATVVLADSRGVVGSGRCGELMVGEAGEYTVLATTPDGRESRVTVTLSALETREVRLTFKAAGGGDGPSEPVGLRVGLRYASIVGYGSGALQTADGAATYDRLPADGAQDELEGLQIARLGHGVEAEVGYAVFGGSWVGVMVQGRWPALSFIAAPFFQLGLLDSGGLELGLRVQAGYGDVLQAMRQGDERFTARSGPGQAGASLRLAVPVTDGMFVSGGVGATVGFPDLGVYGGLDGGVDFRF